MRLFDFLDDVRLRIRPYRKAFVAVAGAIVMGLQLYFGDNSAIVNTAISAATALGVYGVANN